ncbi:NRAMP (natural resistance-associated macrophage protein) metal ion transporters [Haladaptatus litoreus]|uniref:NRAMP (Natural resistance-associated macrophage protein) metal ion transporters n=1 Tax=Haladaptatus litoreus TaxID=553468 RepID=A0A1N7EA72_9EURY|nr:divalent metal cation transporter [Haladaptatus litoreus]SIR84954.1 NRAMP (natural resistance-associated macrophage protein) metal ion transporters [Haladaptatus litoreus]
METKSAHSSYGRRLRDTASGFFQKYGLGFVMVASYFGSGSVFIASSAGVRYGYSLLWAVVGAVLFGFMAQDMSARLGIFGEPLMTFARRKIGGTGATALAALLSIGCVAWTLELTAAVGKGVSILLNGAIGWQPLALVTGLLAILIGVLNYDGVERIMTAMMLILLVIYMSVAGVSNPSMADVAGGFVPSVPAGGALTLAAAIIGTTALWPNFFLESNLVKQKGWVDEKGVSEMRRDLGIGYLVGGLTTVAIVVVAAAVLRPAGYTELETFITPGRALADVFGEWAMVVFLLGTLAAAFNSIVPIMWTPAYLFQNARGRVADSASKEFKIIYAVGVGIGSLSPLVHQFLGLSVIDMILLFPAYNAIVGLPITALLLFWAVNDKKTMGDHRNGIALTTLNFLLVALSAYLAVTSLPGFIDALTSGGL